VPETASGEVVENVEPTACEGNVPSPAARVASTPPPRRDVLRPLTPDQYEVRFTASRGTCDKLSLAKDLLRHSIPDGNTAEVIDRALTVLLEDLARKKYGATVRSAARPQAEGRAEGSAGRAGSRHIPAHVKRTVWMRDGGRCAFVGTSGRCTETGFLQVHHVAPFARNGEATASNLELRCRAHNAYEAEAYFGWSWVRERAPSTSWDVNNYSTK
jgi:hypothetical protein